MAPSRLRTFGLCVLVVCVAFVPGVFSQTVCMTNGQPTFCEPLQDNLFLSLTKWTVNSTCDGHHFCELTNGVVNCSTCSRGQYPSSNLADLASRQTRWQSASLPSATSSVTIDMQPGQNYLLQSLQMEFPLRRPKSMFIEKSRDGGMWESVAFFSDACLARYGLDPKASGPTPNDPAVVTCADTPTATGPGAIRFNWLDGQRIRSEGAVNLQIQTNTALRQWLTADRVRITLDEVNRPLASEVAPEPLDSFNYYASEQLLPASNVSVLWTCAGMQRWFLLLPAQHSGEWLLQVSRFFRRSALETRPLERVHCLPMPT